jgi:hypothetical protein
LKSKAAAEVDVIEEGDEAEAERDEDERENSDEEKEDEREQEDEHDAHDKPSSNAPPKAASLELGVQAGILRRNFDYAGRQGPGLRAFELPGAPQLGATLIVFPFASSSSALSMFGLEAGYSTIVGVTSEFGGKSYDTSASAYRVELVVNLPLGKEASLRPKAGYRGRTLAVAGDTIPNLSEHGPRLGIEGRLATSSFLAELEGGVQYLVSGGELTSAAWFPSASGFGADARARGGLSIATPFQVLVEGGLDYSSFKLNVGANDPHPNGIADSASDISLSLSLLARLVLR